MKALDTPLKGFVRPTEVAKMEGSKTVKMRDTSSKDFDKLPTSYRKNQSPMDLKLGLITRDRTKKLKASNENEDNGMDHSRKQLEGENWLSVREGHPTANGSPTPTSSRPFTDSRSHPTITVGVWLGQC
ncbi:hypothetical protein M9H77_02979 [Catharanthus roseus]|uniref:Uncharacterized protein n=1 Tax=Catharanthus roseus TaxID=4058 RepID=A0ACC0C9Z4_CATRO|nr:hypothetical protein M9H77_02979 [Catharanthus roseus]